ncbi:hypothetical protein RQP46_004398 [Phenoliferia psychrophenolica]
MVRVSLPPEAANAVPSDFIAAWETIRFLIPINVIISLTVILAYLADSWTVIVNRGPQSSIWGLRLACTLPFVTAGWWASWGSVTTYYILLDSRKPWWVTPKIVNRVFGGVGGVFGLAHTVASFPFRHVAPRADI